MDSLDRIRPQLGQKVKGRYRRAAQADAAVPRRAAYLDYECGSGRSRAGGADGAGRTLRLQDDSGLHRPGRRDVPRGGGARRGADARAEIRAEVAATSPHPTTESPATAGLFAARKETERRRSRTDVTWGCQTSPVLKTGWATGPRRSAGDRSHVRAAWRRASRHPASPADS